MDQVEQGAGGPSGSGKPDGLGGPATEWTLIMLPHNMVDHIPVMDQV